VVCEEQDIMKVECEKTTDRRHQVLLLVDGRDIRSICLFADDL